MPQAPVLQQRARAISRAPAAATCAAPSAASASVAASAAASTAASAAAQLERGIERPERPQPSPAVPRARRARQHQPPPPPRNIKITPDKSKATYKVGEIFINQGNTYNLTEGTTGDINGELSINRADPTK